LLRCGTSLPSAPRVSTFPTGHYSQSITTLNVLKAPQADVLLLLLLLKMRRLALGKPTRGFSQ